MLWIKTETSASIKCVICEYYLAASYSINCHVEDPVQKIA